jgi:5'-nucleotidase
MKILLVNEEGCFAPGITALAKVLSSKHRVNIVAPQSTQFGVGHSFTSGHNPLRVREFRVLRTVKIFAVNGTPCDCVCLALDKILKSKPDLIISGIDSQNKRGETIYSSGAVSAAIEGTIQGIPSIALSCGLGSGKDERDYFQIAKDFHAKLPELMKLIKPGNTLNVNFPKKYNKHLVKYTHLTDGLISNQYTVDVNPFGRTYYWLKSPIAGFGLDALEKKGDLYWLKKNYITITPLKLNLTEHEGLEIIQNAGLKL